MTCLSFPLHHITNGCFQVYELNKGNLKLAYERETDAGIKCCTFGASSLEERHLVGFFFNSTLFRKYLKHHINIVAQSLYVALKSGAAVSAL